MRYECKSNVAISLTIFIEIFGGAMVVFEGF